MDLALHPVKISDSGLKRGVVFGQGFIKEIKGKVEQKAVSEERWFLVKGTWKKSRARLNKKQSQKRGGF